MLSNFQFGQQALLQTFLVGQPEFRAILQSPSMQQLRQRVTATCHIGPLDQAETQGYIEHRLECVGASGRPTFDAAAYEAIFKASGGIPRRINLIADRLLLLGCLSDKDAFGLNDVNEVAGEIQDELSASTSKSGAVTSKWGDSGISELSVPVDVDIDLAKLGISAELSTSVRAHIQGQEIEQLDGRLRRLEHSMLRLERINLKTLSALQRLVSAATKSV